MIPLEDSPAVRPAAPLPRPARHSRRHPAGAGGDHTHLWRLPDGTGLHAPYGTLVRSEDGAAVCCHLCGRWYRHLGAHLKVHGLTAADYRERLGLLRTAPLAGTDVSAAIATRQRSAYRSRPAVRQRLAGGQAMARSGRLARLARRAPTSPERAAARTEHLAAGRATARARRRAVLDLRLAEAGAADLGTYLRTRYAAGASLAELARETGLGRLRLRTEVAAAGIAVRSAGQNTLAGRRSRTAR